MTEKMHLELKLAGKSLKKYGRSNLPLPHEYYIFNVPMTSRSLSNFSIEQEQQTISSVKLEGLQRHFYVQNLTEHRY